MLPLGCRRCRRHITPPLRHTPLLHARHYIRRRFTPCQHFAAPPLLPLRLVAATPRRHDVAIDYRHAATIVAISSHYYAAMLAERDYFPLTPSFPAMMIC